jgi:hypothetical protein
MNRAIDETGQRLAAMPESERPAKVLFVVITDGLENASVHVTRAYLQRKVVHQRTVYNWEFFYFGANQDAFTEARTYGIIHGITYAATPAGVRGMSTGVNQIITTARTEDKFNITTSSHGS